uniref:SH2 domain-containing protein n=1 Tax=Steinernema glaseri TaxID=37863 RepID=A0A1I7YDJ0_9BILA
MRINVLKLLPGATNDRSLQLLQIWDRFFDVINKDRFSVVSRHYCSELRHNVWTRVWKAFWFFFDWCLWRFNTGLFSTRRTVVFRNNSDGYVWVHIGAPRFSPDSPIESAALSGMTRVAPLADIPFHLCYDDEDLPKMVIEIYKGKRLATLNFIETKKITDSVAVAVYNSEYLTFHEEPDKVKERMPRREVVAEELDDSSDDHLSTVDSEDDNSTSEVESLDQWNQEYYWHPLAQSHVANATDSSIWVSCLSDLEDVQKLNSYLEEFSNGDRNIVNQVGFTKIRSRKYLVFEPAIRNDRECRVYITVLLEEDDRNLRIISSNFTVWPNYSVIVSREKQILRTEMSYIWTDDSGYRHDEWNR